MNGGDVLARGGRRAQFTVSEGVSQDAWEKIWDGYVPEKSYAVKDHRRVIDVEVQAEISKSLGFPVTPIEPTTEDVPETLQE